MSLICGFGQAIGTAAGFSYITGNQVAPGYSSSSPCSFSLAIRTATYKDCPEEKASRKCFKNARQYQVQVGASQLFAECANLVVLALIPIHHRS